MKKTFLYFQPGFYSFRGNPELMDFNSSLYQKSKILAGYPASL